MRLVILVAVKNVDCGFDAVQSYQRLHGVTSLNITIDRLPLIADFLYNAELIVLYASSSSSCIVFVLVMVTVHSLKKCM
jgi:hypothetical protein